MQKSRLTANPIKPARYRPGKPLTTEQESSSEDSVSETSDVEDDAPPSKPQQPKATSFPAQTGKIVSSLKDVDLNERRRRAAEEEKLRVEREREKRAGDEEGFLTEEEEEEEESGTEEESEDEESSEEEEEPRKVLLRPTFIKKGQRKASPSANDAGNTADDQTWAEEEKRRKADADALIREQLEKDAALKAAGKKSWDDDEENEGGDVNDEDGVDPEAELAAWKLRELKRVKREREAIETAEEEREEIERRRNLSKEEREREDQEFLDKQKEEQDGKGKMQFMQRYLHKGAFFQDDMEKQGLDKRDIMGASFVDEVKNREALPQFMQIRDMTKLGRKGRTKYKDMRTEDTGRWGEYRDVDKRRKDLEGIHDERFQPDRGPGPGGPSGATGANASVLKERPRRVEGAPEGPRAMREDGGDRDRDRGDTYRPRRYSDDESDRSRTRRRRSRSRNRSRSRQRDQYERKRSHSRDGRYDGDKRRRVDAT